MNAPRRRWLLALAIPLLLGPTGCGGDVPATGTQAIVPPDYEAKEKAIGEQFRASMKRQARPKAH